MTSQLGTLGISKLQSQKLRAMTMASSQKASGAVSTPPRREVPVFDAKDVPPEDIETHLAKKQNDYVAMKLRNLEDSLASMQNASRVLPTMRVEEAPVNWMYGHARKRPQYVEIPHNVDMRTLLRNYEKDPSLLTFKAARSQEWYLLYYPMDEVHFSEDDRECFMRCKAVDRDTGQMSWMLMRVYQKKGGKDIRTFRYFSTHT
jgi:hypothetical protein